LRRSQRKFPVHDDEVAEFEIVKSFDHPEPAHLNRSVAAVTLMFLCLSDRLGP
jgi:hypothetical protein